MSGSAEWLICASRDEAAERAADLLAGALELALDKRARASLLVSGGSTPGPCYQRLAREPLDWAQIDVGLVDERWVDEDDPASNARLIRQTLLQDAAAEATFAPMKTAHADPLQGLSEAEARYGALAYPFDAVLLGMGPDGHTASLFPRAAGLVEALELGNPKLLAAIDAAGASVAGDNTLRMTLTLSAIASARTLVLLITGEDKRAVLDQARAADPLDMPIRAVLGAAPHLQIIWSP